MLSAALTLRVLKVPVKAPVSSFVKVPSVLAMIGLLWLRRRDRSLRCLAHRDRIGRRYHRERASGRSTAEDLGGEKICSEAAARRPALSPAGEIFSPDKLGAVTAGSSA